MLSEHYYYVPILKVKEVQALQNLFFTILFNVEMADIYKCSSNGKQILYWCFATALIIYQYYSCQLCADSEG
jgi:hypothetical protein